MAESQADSGIEATNSSENEPRPTKEHKNLDLAFAMDCTGSMGSYIQQARQNIRKITEDIVCAEKADIRLALIEYRDHPPQDSSFVTRVHDFTSSVREMKSWLEECSANGGGDAPEAVADALHQLLKLTWRENSTKICVFIADAPPHGLGCGGDGFPNGCPAGLDPMVITNELAAKGVTIYTVGCEPSIVRWRDWFMALSQITGGQYIPLNSATVLAKVITAGAEEELSLESLMAEVNTEVVQECSDVTAPVSRDTLYNKIHSKLASKGMRSKKLVSGEKELAKPSGYAQQLAQCSSMSACSKAYDTVSPPSGMAAAPPKMSVRGGFFSKKKKVNKSAVNRLDAEMCDAAVAGPSPAVAMAPGAPPSMDYTTVEDEVSAYQVERMVNRAINMNALQSQVKFDEK